MGLVRPTRPPPKATGPNHSQQREVCNKRPEPLASRFTSATGGSAHLVGRPHLPLAAAPGSPPTAPPPLRAGTELAHLLTGAASLQLHRPAHVAQHDDHGSTSALAQAAAKRRAPRPRLVVSGCLAAADDRWWGARPRVVPSGRLASSPSLDGGHSPPWRSVQPCGPAAATIAAAAADSVGLHSTITISIATTNAAANTGAPHTSINPGAGHTPLASRCPATCYAHVVHGGGVADPSPTCR